MLLCRFATLNVSVRNLGPRTSDVVVQVFAANTASSPPGALANPLRQLAGFERSSDLSEVEGSREIPIVLETLAFTRVDTDGDRWVEPALWRLLATVDGMAMHNATLVVTGPRLRVLSWPTSGK